MKGASRWLEAKAPPPAGSVAASSARPAAVNFLSFGRMAVSFCRSLGARIPLRLATIARRRGAVGNSGGAAPGRLERGEDGGCRLRVGLIAVGHGEQGLAVHQQPAAGDQVIEGAMRIL